MCGVAGVLGVRDVDVYEPRVRAALARMESRGPDQHGLVRLEHGGGWFGHRRLSIVDLSEAGRQPMALAQGAGWLVFNGEIYNFLELRRELEQRFEFRSQSDTEVLAHGYLAWGMEGLLARARGMFAFAVWDARERVLHVARDHIGEKPLFHAPLPGGGLAFASTLPALLELLPSTPPLRARSVVDYLMQTCVPAPHSIFEGVHKLAPAHRLSWRPGGGGASVARYWSLAPSSASTERGRPFDERAWVDRFDRAVQDSVRERLVADVPVGSFLSGGVDSGLVTAVMARVATKPCVAVSMGFHEPEFDERPHARVVARACGVAHEEVLFEPHASRELPALVASFGEPFGDHSAMPLYLLARAARRHVTVALTGDGGDEAFAGYVIYLGVRVAQAMNRVPGFASGRVAEALARVPSAHRLLRRARWVAELARDDGRYVYDPLGQRAFRGRLDGVAGGELARALAGYDPDARNEALWAQNSSEPDWVDRALRVDMHSALPDDFLTKTDGATMAHSLEARSPLLDVRLLELARQVPGRRHVKALRSKALLKRVVERYLPREVLYRRKQGFSPPTSYWMRDVLGDRLASVLASPRALDRGLFRREPLVRMIDEHRTGSADHGQRLWLLLVLELWCRMYLDGDLRPGDDLIAYLDAQ